jgi:hypothetical protein
MAGPRCDRRPELREIRPAWPTPALVLFIPLAPTLVRHGEQTQLVDV